MRCARPHCHLFSKHSRIPDPPLLQTFTYINAVGESYRAGDKKAIMRTLADAAAPPHCWTCSYSQKGSWRGEEIWLLRWLWLRLLDGIVWFGILLGLFCSCVFWRRRDLFFHFFKGNRKAPMRRSSLNGTPYGQEYGEGIPPPAYSIFGSKETRYAV